MAVCLFLQEGGKECNNAVSCPLVIFKCTVVINARTSRYLVVTSRTIILPVVLYGCETWSLILREERNLRVFENMVLGRIFGPWRDEVTGEWRRLHNEELNDL